MRGLVTMLIADDANRRRVGRRPIPGVEAILRALGDVKVLDVGLYGLAIEIAAELEVGESYCLEIRHGRNVASVEVTVRWASVSAMARERRTLVPLTRAGVVFTDIVRERDAGIWRWILVPDAGSC